MTYVFDGEVITEVANFKEKGLVTPEGGEGEKRYSENKFAHAGVSVQKARVLTTTLVCRIDV